MPEPIRSVDDYVRRLREELRGSDPALVQDATYDATEYLQNELAARAEAAPPETLLDQIVEEYGTPAEIAEAYRQTEVKVAAALASPRPARPRSVAERLFGVFVDPHAWGALLFMFLALPTGIVYFTWVVTGLSLSAGLAILIFGAPFFLLFVGSVRALSLAEGRFVEALLGVRMPRRPPPAPVGTLWPRIKFWVTDIRTWSTMVYMALRLPIGVVCFTFFTTLLSVALACLAGPFLGVAFGEPVIHVGEFDLGLPGWAQFLVFWPVAFVLLLIGMHLAFWTGKGVGWLARTMLVHRLPEDETAATVATPAAGPAAPAPGNLPGTGSPVR